MNHLVAVALHQAAQDQGQPPLSAAGPAIHPTATIHRCRFGPWTAIGARSRLQDSTMAAYSYVVEDAEIAHASIGRFCSIAAATRLNPGNHPTWRASQHHFQYRAASYGLGADEAGFFAWRQQHAITLGHDVWVGHGAVILAGRQIGDGAVIGAGSIVARDVGPYEIVAGNPARLIRPRFPAAIARRLQTLAWWDWPHELLALRLDDFRTLQIEAFLEKYAA